jgi:6-pyruvoyltetrahydropterin/6-carboxytetrahydropterin synthase
MIMDLGLLERALDAARQDLDHRFLDEIKDLGPATMENLSVWIWRRIEPACPSLWRVTVRRDSDQGACSYFGRLQDAEDAGADRRFALHGAR